MESKFLRGYPSSVVLLSRYAQKFDIKLNHLKSIFVASEFLSDADRKEIEKIFKVKILIIMVKLKQHACSSTFCR